MPTPINKWRRLENEARDVITLENAIVFFLRSCESLLSSPTHYLQIGDSEGFPTFVVQDDDSQPLEHMIDENVAVIGPGIE